MFLISWLYVILTLFEPTHQKDTRIVRWDSEFTSLFFCELSILVLFFIDFLLSFYHNFFERKFKDQKQFHVESHIEEAGVESVEEPVNLRAMPRRNTMVERTLKITIQVPTEPKQPSSKLIAPSPPNTAEKGSQKFKFVKIFLLTLFEQGLIFKLVIMLVFYTDFIMYFSLYPHNYYRFSRFARTIPFAIFSKATKRTLQAVYHSVKRIFDFFIFFFSIVFLYALLGYKIFDDEGRSYYISPNYDIHINDYSNYGIIVNSLIVLVTFDNYPLVMRPFTESTMWYLVYFMPYIMLNILFFIPVPIAVVYDGFREKRSKLTVEDHLKEKEALFTSYLSLTGGQSRNMSFNDLDRLMVHIYSGNLTRAQVRQIFQQLDLSAKGKFGINDFLGLTDIINSDPSLVSFDWEFKIWGKLKAFLNRWLKIKTIVNHFSFEIVMLVVILLNSCNRY